MKCPICENDKFLKIKNLTESDDPNLETYACTNCGYVLMLKTDAKSIYDAYKKKADRLDRVIKEKIEEHKRLTNYSGTNKAYNDDIQKKADKLYEEINDIINEYQEIVEKSFLKK